MVGEITKCRISLFLLFLILFVVTVRSEFRFACEDNYCSALAAPCTKLDCTDGRVIKHATQCGCCDVCIKSLDIGAECSNLEHAALPRVECGPGLMCIEKKCVPASTKCSQDLLDSESDDGLSEMITSKPRPKCDDFGFYAAVSCKAGMLCFCVNKEGQRIFGTAAAADNETIDCDCSREFEEFQEYGKLEKKEQFLLCLANGNFDPLQCTDDWCFCMGEDGDMDGRPIESNTTLSSLKCYDTERHKGFDMILRSRCWRERESVQEQMEEYKRKGITVVGVDLPECDLDGTYAPIQCKRDSCYCVKKDGTPYPDYIVKRNSKLAEKMTCRCVREKELLRKDQLTDRVTAVFSQYKCLSNGNYQPMQCISSSCFCVDEMGFQDDEAVLTYDRKFLKCYNEDFEDDHTF